MSFCINNGTKTTFNIGKRVVIVIFLKRIIHNYRIVGELLSSNAFASLWEAGRQRERERERESRKGVVRE